MEENRRIVYYLEALGNASVLERSIAKLSGVLSVRVDEQESLLEYTIDEWASDYDVFTEVMRICSECGAAIDFDRKPDEENDLSDDEPIAEQSNIHAEVEEEVEEASDDKKKKKSGGISERAQRFIELSVAIVAYIVGLFLTDTTQYMFFAVAFAFAGYDALYEAIVKITKRQIFSEELLISLAFIASILLGYTSFAVIGLLLYSTVSFARKTIREEIDKNPAFAKQEQKIMLAEESGVKKVNYAQIKVGDSILLSAGAVSAFDGELECDCDVEDFKGTVRNTKSGEQIYAGEKLLADAQIKITAMEENCKFGKFNKFINQACRTTAPIAEKIQKNSQLITLIVLGACLLIAFLPPIFYSSYKSALTEWAYKAVILAAISGMGFYIFASEINLLSALARARRCKLGFAGYESIEKLANANNLFIDHECALLDENGEIKEDTYGAVRETKDSGVAQISLACNLSDDSAVELCKQLKINEYYSRETVEEKYAVIKENLGNGAVVTTASKKENVENGTGAIVCFNCESEGYVGDACLASDEIAYLPYAIKLAKRTVKIQRMNLILGLSVKAVIAILALLGLAQLWWAVLADSLVSVICAVGAYINSKEIY